MSLPKIDQPLFEMTIPSTQKKVKFRPFLVKEEKILLVAQQSESDRDIIRAIKQVLNNCIVDGINVDDLATFDLEYMFLKLRAKSVNNVVKLSYRDNEDDKVYDFEIDLDEIEIKKSEGITNKIQINDEVGIVMQYPSASITEELGEYESEVDLLMFFVKKSIAEIYDSESVYVVKEQSEEELDQFIDSLDVSTFEKIREFFEAMPRLYHSLTYTNEMGNERVIELTNLKDFFMWR
jgi:hypothetical protein